MNTKIHFRVRRTRGRTIAAGAVLAGLLLTAALTLPTGAPGPAGASGPPIPDPVASGIDRLVSAQIRDAAIPGAAVAVIRGEKVLMVRGYGHDSTGRPVTGDSLFRIASLSKSFTALAVMQLVDAGRLGLDDPVQQHLPEFQLADLRAGQVTVRELLDHTSGLTDAMVPDLSRTPPRTTREATTSLRTAHLATTPGTSWSYHNPNYEVAARLVEVLSGEPFDVYLRRDVLEPAGMISSTSTTTDDQRVPGLTEGHVTAYRHAFTAPGMGTFTIGGGGVVSTAADMARWLIVHANGGRSAGGTRLVSAEGMRLLHTPSAPKVGYALGWATYGPAGAPTRLDHSGSLLNFTAEEAIWPGTGYGVVLLFNAGSPMMLDQTAIVHGVYDIVEGTTPPSRGPHLAARLDTALAALTVLALILGMFGVAHAGRWSRRRNTPLRRALGLLPAVAVLGVGAVFPQLAEALLGRDVTWQAAAYGWPALVLFVLAALLAAAATLLARTWQARTGRADRRHEQAVDQPGVDTSARSEAVLEAR
jgi:CubicO group peptidase (beta-lactamase class C family)